jgi:hypothetical protein
MLLIARPDFVTDRYDTNAISLAAQNRRQAIIERLIELRVDVSVRDGYGKSPLFYAAGVEDVTVVDLLLQADAHLDDGSLHEAARLCHTGIVAMLLQAGHDQDYPSENHGGRTALGELCLRANLDTKQLESQAFRSMSLLLGARADLTKRIEGKSVLHLALLNDRPVEITKALLRFPEVWKDIQTDSETFLYEDARDISMSPNHYVTECCTCSESHKRDLQELLKNKQCKGKWFKKRGAQVPKPEGLPPSMREAQDREDLADQIALRAIERQKKRAKADLEVEKERHDAKIKQNKEQTAADYDNTQLLHSQQLQHDNDISSQRRRNANLERDDQQNHAKGMAKIEYDSLQNKSQLRYRMLEKETDLEKRMIADRDAADQQMHKRAMQRTERQDESIRLAAREQRQFIEASKAARVTVPSQLRLPYEEEVD